MERHSKSTQGAELGELGAVLRVLRLQEFPQKEAHIILYCIALIMFSVRFGWWGVGGEEV